VDLSLLEPREEEPARLPAASLLVRYTAPSVDQYLRTRDASVLQERPREEEEARMPAGSLLRKYTAPTVARYLRGEIGAEGLEPLLDEDESDQALNKMLGAIGEKASSGSRGTTNRLPRLRDILVSPPLVNAARALELSTEIPKLRSLFKTRRRTETPRDLPAGARQDKLGQWWIQDEDGYWVRVG